MGSCKECRFWRAFTEERAGFGECERAYENRNERIQGVDLAARDGYEGYYAWLETTANFGCKRFETRPKEAG